MLDSAELKLLRCPMTKAPLVWASSDLVQAVQDKLGDDPQYARRRRPGEQSVPLESALVTEDGRMLYPVHRGIPKLLSSESIDLAALGLAKPSADS